MLNTIRANTIRSDWIDKPDTKAKRIMLRHADKLSKRPVSKVEKAYNQFTVEGV